MITSTFIRELESGLPKMEKVIDLIYHEGPLLSLYQDNMGNYYFYKWCERKKEEHLWVVFEVSVENLINFYHKEMSLRDLMTILWNQTVFFLYINEGFETKITSALGKEAKDYLPQKDSYFEETQYEEEAVLFLSNLKEKDIPAIELQKIRIVLSDEPIDNGILEVLFCKKNKQIEVIEIAFQLLEQKQSTKGHLFYHKDKNRFNLYIKSKNEILLYCPFWLQSLQTFSFSIDDALDLVKTELLKL